MMPNDLGPEGFKDPETLFSYMVETGGRVLTTTTPSRDFLLRLGYDAFLHEQDLRFLGVPAGSLDAVWWREANRQYSIEDAFRILQSFFQGLKPKKGVLLLSFRTQNPPHIWEQRIVMTLLRQTGFQLFHSFESSEESLFFCQRL